VTKELVIISGKGGTGKTSILASFASLADAMVLADADVDAADLHLVLSPEVKRRESFSGGSKASIDESLCTGCGTCFEVCRFQAVLPVRGGQAYAVDEVACEGCGVCAYFCPEKAVDFSPVVNGEWFVSETRRGPMVHARLGIAEENSGKLVTLVRKEARKIAEEKGIPLLLVDGSPGIGCPVIASISGADLVLIVTEPTVAGEHDLDRVSDLTRHFGIPSMVCINKADLNPEVADRIEEKTRKTGLGFAGRLSYDPAFTEAQIEKKSVVEKGDGRAAGELREVWREVREALDGRGRGA